MRNLFIWFVWLGLVSFWNFTFPNVHPWEDVFVAVCLSWFTMFLKSDWYRSRI